MRQKLSLAALCFAWLCANGALWNVVQVVAWAKMFHDYSAVMPVERALKLTFDGSAPCTLCAITQNAQDDAREQLPLSAALGGSDKLLIIFQPTPPVVVAAVPSAWPGLVNESGLQRTDAVPVPPPRA